MTSLEKQVQNLIAANERLRAELRAVRAEKARAETSEKLAWEKVNNMARRARPVDLAEAVFRDG